MFFRSIAAAIVLASQALAGPALTTIQDVLYKADGTRFNGTLTISWSSFQTADDSTIVTQSTTVKVVDGNLRVQLAPSTSATPAIFYSVTYNSDGRVQFQETWSVPSSAQALRVRDVRVATGNQSAPDTGGSGGTGGTGGGPVQESDVIGLIADLGSRPLKGPGYAAGRVAMVNPLGALETVTGSASDCVRVDGSSGPCGGEPVAFVDGDSPSGIVDGSNTMYSLANVPSPASSLAVYRNGVLMKAGQDYTVSGQTIQFVAASTPEPGDTLLASYRVAGTETSAPLYPNPQVLCSGTGAATASATLASVGTCSIPGGVLAAGDRVEIRFDLEHQGTAGGFAFEVHWGGTAIGQREAPASEALVSGRADATLLAAGAQLSYQTWGAALPLAAGVASAADAYASGVTIDFQGSTQGGDTLALRNFTVVRVP